MENEQKLLQPRQQVFAALDVRVCGFPTFPKFCGIACVRYLMTALAPPLGSHFHSGMPILCLGLILVALKIAFLGEREAKRTFLIADGAPSDGGSPLSKMRRLLLI